MGIRYQGVEVKISKIVLSNSLMSLTGLTKCFGSLMNYMYSSQVKSLHI
jgi:hypothetical protein